MRRCSCGDPFCDWDGVRRCLSCLLYAAETGIMPANDARATRHVRVYVAQWPHDEMLIVEGDFCDLHPLVPLAPGARTPRSRALRFETVPLHVDRRAFRC